MQFKKIYSGNSPSKSGLPRKVSFVILNPAKRSEESRLWKVFVYLKIPLVGRASVPARFGGGQRRPPHH